MVDLECYRSSITTRANQGFAAAAGASPKLSAPVDKADYFVVSNASHVRLHSLLLFRSDNPSAGAGVADGANTSTASPPAPTTTTGSRLLSSAVLQAVLIALLALMTSKIVMSIA